MDTSPERKSEYAKRVLFGGGGGAASKAAAAAAAAADKPAVSGAVEGGTRSGSHSSTSSAPSVAVYSTPSTPRNASNTSGENVLTPSKPVTSNNAALAVFLRVRPPGTVDADLDELTGRRTYQILEDKATLRTFPPLSAGHSRTINRQAKDFGFTQVFSTTANQTETYESTMKPLVDDVFSSRNALLFAYGMTNAGKTYTVLGEDGSPGLIPQALTDTFQRVSAMQKDEPEVRVEMSFLEIYIENVYDLLAAADADDWAKARSALKLDDRMGVIQARDLSKHVIRSAADGLDLVKRATANRRVASTKLNEDSSRSHSVCMIKLVRSKGKDSNLWVVDLAGSERSGRTGAGATSTRQKEANNINKSLSTLWHCLTIMRANLRKDEPETRVPFRESKLTHLFKNHLQGPAAGKTVMVVNINPSTEDFDETQQVLKNSTIARDVKTVRDESAANRQNGLINTPYGFNGRKMVVKKPAGSRRSIHQAVAPKLEGLGPPPPRTITMQGPSPKLAKCSGDTDCDSDGEGERGDGGYMSGAESDSGLVDARQSMNLVVRNLQGDNESLKKKLKATIAAKRTKDTSRGHQPISGGPLEQYIALLEERVSASEVRMQEMREEHQLEVQELEEEFEGFISENGLGDETVALPSGGVDASVARRLEEQARVANLQADQWKKEAETLRARLQGVESRMTPSSTNPVGVGPSSTRSPLRQSTGSASQGRPSIENRQDGENSPPGGGNQLNGGNGGSPSNNGSGLTPGGVGSPSKKQTRNTPSTPKSKASALPSKSKKKKTPSPKSGGANQQLLPQQQQQAGGDAASYSLTAAAIDAASVPQEGEGADGRVSSDKQAGGGPREGFGVGLSELRESGGSGKEGGGKSKVVIAVSRRVSVLRVSTAGGRRVSSVRASLAGGRRASRASHSNGNRRVSHLRSRVSTNGPTISPVAGDQEAAAPAVPEDVEEEEDNDDGESSFRRESGMT
ncbi:unnamed protein product, partial [Laminaria digitata]